MQKIELLDPEILRGRDVLKGFEIAAFRKAEDIIGQANDWMADRRATVEQEIEQERREAFAEAYSDGLNNFIDAVEKLVTERKALENRVAAMVTAGLTKVLSNLPSEEVLLDLMRPAFGSIQAEQEIFVLGHPDDLHALTVSIAALKDEFQGSWSASVVPDGEIESGNCMIYTEDEVFKVGITVAVEHLHNALASEDLKDEVHHAK